jgi:AcrR family transcriptional regulator
MIVHSVMADGSTSARGDKREQILDAALSLFSTFGFHGTAVPAIAKKAGVGAGTIYRYFESKEALVNELFRREKERILAAIMGEFPADSPPRDQFHYFVQKVVSYARENRASFEFLEHHHHSPYLDDRSCAVEKRVIALVNAFLAHTSQAKVTKPISAGLLMSIVWGALIHLLKDAWAGQLELDDQSLKDVETVLWEAIRL